MVRLRTVACLVAAVSATEGALWAQCQPAWKGKLNNAALVSLGAEFGSGTVDGRLAIDGDEVLTGYTTQLNAGVVRRYANNGTGWSVVGTIGAPDATHGFGWSFALDGDTLVVGAPYDDDVALDAGAVYVFTRSGGSWIFDSKLFGSDSIGLDRFGERVAMQGSILAVMGPQRGQLYLFEHQASGWIESARFQETSWSMVYGPFGSTLAVSGTDVFAGWPNDGEQAHDAGSVVVYRHTAGGFVSLGKVFTPAAEDEQFFGSSVAASDDWLVAAAPRSDVAAPDGGAAFVYRKVGGAWQFHSQLLSPSPSFSEFFGSGVAIELGHIVVGARGYDANDPDVGRGFVFAYDGSAWNPVSELHAAFPVDSDFFGASVTLAHGRAVLGGTHGLVNQIYGNAFIFDLGCEADVYCSPKVNSLGCVPLMTHQGQASATSLSPCFVGADEVLNFRSGLLFYGYAQANQPFQDGTLCVATPVRRTPVQDSGGNAGTNDCSGQYALDFNARIQSGVDAALVPGAEVFLQYWSRDPAAASTTGLTNALRVQIAP